MFDTAILESVENAPQTRRWSTLASFTLQAFCVAVMLVSPLIFTQPLPQLHYADRISVPSAPRIPERVMEIVSSDFQRSAVRSEFSDGVLVAPPSIPSDTHRIVDVSDTNISATTAPSVPYSVGNAQQDTIISKLIASTTVAPPNRVDTRREPLKVSSLSEGMIVHKVQPIYPEIARLAHVQGPVVISAVIDTTGRVTSLHPVAGHPMLVAAAIDAIKQWRYRPYVLNGQAIEVETQVSVMFTLR